MQDTSNNAVPAADSSQDTSPSQAKPKSFLRRRFVVLLIPLAALLVLIAMLYVQEYLHCARLEATGDPLFDKYAQAVRDRWARRLFYTGTIEGSPNPASLPDEVLAEWEPQFGGDPRYWELRCWNANSARFPYLSKDRADAWSRGNEFLDEAIKRGLATSNIYLLRYMKRRGELDALNNHNRTLSDAEFAELRAVLDAAVAAGPDESMAYYKRALLSFERQDVATGLADIRLGNQQNDWHALGMFPHDFVRERQLKQQASGNALISQCVLLGNGGGFTDHWWSLKEGAKSLRKSVRATRNLAALDEFNTALCLMGIAHASDEWATLIITSHLRGNARLALLVHPQPTERQRETALWAYRFVDELYDYVDDMDMHGMVEMQLERELSWTGRLGFLLPPTVMNTYLRSYFEVEADWGVAADPARYRYLMHLDYAADDFGYAKYRTIKPPFYGEPGPVLAYDLKPNIETPSYDF